MLPRPMRWLVVSVAVACLESEWVDICPPGKFHGVISAILHLDGALRPRSSVELCALWGEVNCLFCQISRMCKHLQRPGAFAKCGDWRVLSLPQKFDRIAADDFWIPPHCPHKISSTFLSSTHMYPALFGKL